MEEQKQVAGIPIGFSVFCSRSNCVVFTGHCCDTAACTGIFAVSFGSGLAFVEYIGRQAFSLAAGKNLGNILCYCFNSPEGLSATDAVA